SYNGTSLLDPGFLGSVIASDALRHVYCSQTRWLLLMASEPLITTYLEMRSPNQLRPKRADARFQVREKTERDWRFNRDLYFRVGEQWDWVDKRPWRDDQWKEYATSPELRTFAGYYHDALVGYYELRQDREDGVEIAYFG